MVYIVLPVVGHAVYCDAHGHVLSAARPPVLRLIEDREEVLSSDEGITCPGNSQARRLIGIQSWRLAVVPPPNLRRP